MLQLRLTRLYLLVQFLGGLNSLRSLQSTATFVDVALLCSVRLVNVLADLVFHGTRLLAQLCSNLRFLLTHLGLGHRVGLP